MQLTSVAVNIVVHLDRFHLEHLAGNIRRYLDANPDSMSFTLLVQGGNDLDDVEEGHVALLEVEYPNAPIWEHGKDPDRS